MSLKDYIKNDETRISRPILSIYELSGAITSLAKVIYNDKSLSKYIDDTEVNNIVNPAKIATELLLTNKYDALINRNSETVKFKDLYINYLHVDMLKNYFNKQDSIVQKYILDKITE